MQQHRCVLRNILIGVGVGALLWMVGCDDNPGDGGTNTNPGGIHVADTLVVRAILDSNGLTAVAVDSVAVFSGTRVTSVRLAHLGLGTIPVAIGQLDALQGLYLNDNQLTTLPESITHLTALVTLTVGGNLLCDLSASIAAWLDSTVTLPNWRNTQECVGHTDDSALVRLILDTNGLAAVAVDEVSDTTATGRIHSLALAHRELTILPVAIGGLEQLATLDVHDNHLSALPDTLRSLNLLTFLDIEYNRLCSLSVAMAAWADSLAPGWQAYQECTAPAYDTALFDNGPIDTIDERDPVWPAMRAGNDSLIVDSITLALDSTAPPITVTFQPIGIAAYTRATDSLCEVRSHGVSYGDSAGSALLTLSPGRSAYLVGTAIQICMACSTESALPVLRDGDSLHAELVFSYRRLYPDTTLAGRARVVVAGTMDAVTIGAHSPRRRWFMEIYTNTPPYESIAFDSLPDTCESYLDIRADTPFDLAFAPDSLSAPGGIRRLGTLDPSGRLLPCTALDSLSTRVSAERYAYVQTGYQPKVPYVNGGVYWLRTLDNRRVLLVHVYRIGGAYERDQVYWALYNE